MTRKWATIAVRGELNNDEQFGCVVLPNHLASTHIILDFNQPRATTPVAVTWRAMWCSRC
ncbi:MAG: hypothetical protein GPOALKHO_001035 [Sodalis sp.]|nr:MAG: hypothetical protein GPOALKHO_001035 [Sodalis sp.]